MGGESPLWSMASMEAEGREPPLRLDLPVSRSPDLAENHFLYSRRSVTLIGLKFGHDFYPDIGFLAAKEGHQPPYGVATRAQGAPDPLGRAPHPRGPLGHRLALIPVPKIHIYSRRNLRQFLSRLDSV